MEPTTVMRSLEGSRILCCTIAGDLPLLVNRRHIYSEQFKYEAQPLLSGNMRMVNSFQHADGWCGRCPEADPVFRTCHAVNIVLADRTESSMTGAGVVTNRSKQEHFQAIYHSYS